MNAFIRFDFRRLPVLAMVALCFVVLTLVACSKKENAHSRPAAIQTFDPATAGEITGTVVLDGAPPPPQKILLNGEPECAQLNHGSLAAPVVVAGPHGGLANVAVYIKSGLANYHFDPPAAPVQLTQKDCMYQPRVIALMTHQPLIVQNEDPIQHNVHPTPHDNPAFNATQTVNGPPIQKEFYNQELAIRFMCNLHPWMRAYVFVFSHPYFAVTTDTGTFDVRNIPPGSYIVEAWHEKYGTQDQKITIGPNETKSITFSFKS